MVSLAAQEWIKQGLAEGRAKGLAEGRAKGLAEGRAKGLAEGRAKGLAEGMAESILIALETRFGLVPEFIENRVREAEPEQLKVLFRRAMTTPSLQAFFSEFQR
jgi:flagellar biosynthesis/type III secretory pathway protein FliH